MTSDLHHLAAAYALDALDADERDRFEAHLDDCETCRRDVADFAATAVRLAEGAAVAPPSDLRDRVMAGVATTRQLPPVVGAPVSSLAARARRFAPGMLLAVAAAIVLIAVGAVVLVSQRGGSGIDDLIAAPDVVVRTLDGSPGTIQIAWSPGRDRVAFIGNGLPEPAEGFVYELWAIADGTPVPSGLFDPSDGKVRALADVDVDAVAWGVTIEPAGGSPAPTGEILYFAEI
jgi:anti-sigma-K factor RskA